MKKVAIWGSGIACTAIMAITAGSCALRHDDVEPEVSNVAQAIAGDCGFNYSDCAMHASCTSWDLNTPGDGLGYSVSSWTEYGTSFMQTCLYPGPGCDDWDWVDSCPETAAARRSALIAARPGISQSALNGLTIGINYTQDCFIETGCGPFDDWCYDEWDFHCDLAVNNFPTPLTGVHDWCPCAQFRAVDCEPSTIAVGGTGHTCAVVGGGIQCWGANMNGQLGNGMNTQSVQPVSVMNMTSGAYTVAAGGLHTCAITQGAAKCWGQNVNGQLGTHRGV